MISQAASISRAADGMGRKKAPALAALWGVVLVLALVCLWQAATAQAAGGVPQAVWQASERNHRRSPPQVKTQLRSEE
ncbi:flagella basal body P-ring formation protein FlgA, partial [Desulfovibrio sp. 1188_IL3213]